MKIDELERLYRELSDKEKGQKTLLDFSCSSKNKKRVIDICTTMTSPRFRLPRQVNWEALRVVYETQPENSELCIREIGPAIARALVLISELIYGDKPSWKDPLKFSFTFGGKDGVPYPVDKKRMEEVTEILRNVIKKANIGQCSAIKLLKNKVVQT